MNYNFNEVLQRLVERVIIFIPHLVVAIIIFVATFYLAGLAAGAVKKMMKKRRSDPELAMLFSRVTHWTIVIFGLIWALEQVNFNITGFVAGLGIVGFTVGFALQDIAKNFVAGILLLLQQPFDISDIVEVSGFNGTVMDIQIRSTTVRTQDGLLVIIPNADVYGNPITNYSKIDRRRISITLGVTYASDLQKVDETLHKVAAELPGVKKEPAPQVVFNEFGATAIKVTLYFWINVTETSYFKALDGAIKEIKLAFEHEEIQISA